MKKTNLRKLLLVGAIAIGALGFSQASSAATLTQEQAKAIVMKEVPNGQITKMELDYDHGRQVYEIEVMDGNVEKDFDIDAETGTILKMDMDHHNHKHHKGHKHNHNSNMNMEQPKVSYEQAKDIALKASKNGTFKEIELKVKNGVQVYDVEVAEGIMDREFLIDANTGSILRDKKDF